MMTILSTARSILLGDPQLVQHQPARLVGAPEQGVADRVRLVVDLLRHEGRRSRPSRRPRRPSRRGTACPAPGVPSKPMTVSAVGVIVTIWSWPSSSASRVCPMNAATSEPRKFSPSPRPTTSGELRRAPTTTPGCVGVHGEQGEGAVEAAARPARIASVRSPIVVVGAGQQLGGDLGVGLGLERHPVGLQLGLERVRSSR